MGAPATVGFIIGFVATVGIIFTTIHNEWKRNSQQDSDHYLNNIYKCEGLWMQCYSSLKGVFSCDTFDTAILGLPPQLQAMRGMMVVSCILSVLAIAANAYGLDCNSSATNVQKLWAKRCGGAMLLFAASLQCQRAFMVIAGIASVCGLVAGAMGQDCVRAVEGKQKLWSGRAGGILMLIAGVLTLGSVSWYAAEVIREFWLDEAIDSSFQYEFGAALYIGWIASGLALIAGALMLCCSCGEEADDYEPRYTYNPPKKQAPRNTEYV